MTTLLCRMKGYIQPFERVLALREITQLSGCEPLPTANVESPLIYRIETEISADELASRLAYWEDLRNGASGPYVPIQIQREASASNGNGFATRMGNEARSHQCDSVPNRRVLRYGPHLLHEYRGRFFPQLVRALLNAVGATPKTLVADTMCGSGTTLVEATLLGCSSYGLDMNPLSVFMGKAKCEILRIEPDRIEEVFESLSKTLNRGFCGLQEESPYLASLSPLSQSYLRRWFPFDIFKELCWMACEIQKLDGKTLSSFFMLLLSNIIRTVSYQKDDDLRVRRDEDSASEGSAIELYLRESGKIVRSIVKFLRTEGFKLLGRSRLLEGDARSADRLLGELKGKVDVIITSPPYATALPYLDTDRLSLYFLNLLSREAHRARDLCMIGNREISNRLRDTMWQEYIANRHKLPAGVSEIIDKIDVLNKNGAAGFQTKKSFSFAIKIFPGHV